MGRSERFIPPTKSEERRQQHEADIKLAYETQRDRLTEKSLRKLKKDKLITLLMNLAMSATAPRWLLEANLEIPKTVDLIVYDLRDAIQIATHVDHRRLNYNFHYSSDAYEEVARGFVALIDKKELTAAKDIAVEFLAKASYQVECSDEGMMVEEIEACLSPVLIAVMNDEPLAAISWANAMKTADRTGFICDSQFKKLLALNLPTLEPKFASTPPPTRDPPKGNRF